MTNILSFFSKPSPTNESHIKNLVFLANIDGHFHEKEDAYLSKVATQYGIKPSKLSKIKDGKKYVEFRIPKSNKLKFRHLCELTKMMLADGKIHPKESELCYLYACDYGYAPERVENIFNQLIQSIEKGYSIEDIFDQMNTE